MGAAGNALRALTIAVALGLGLAAPATAGAGAVDDYQSSWEHRALGLQYALGGDVPLRNAPWVGTHNSFNSVAEMGPTLSNQDSNQKLDLTDQLRIDIRSLELDVHRFPNLEIPPAYRPVVCHATGEHAGCTIEKSLGPVLAEIGAWLRMPENWDQILLLYLEDHLDNQQGYDDGAAAVESELGDLVYRPAGPGCTQLPLDLTRDDVRAAGKQVLIVSGCGIGSAWPAVAFDWGSHVESRPFDYEGYPGCGPDYDRATYDSNLVRYYEDSTQLTAHAGTPDDGIPPETATQMARCGVDLIGLDQLEPSDGRLGALVWSWAPGQPGARRCAVQRVDATSPEGRWFTRPCRKRRRPACLSESGWLVPKRAVRQRRAAALCQRRGAVHSVPRTGYEVQLLRQAMESAATVRVWLGYRRVGSEWTAADSG